MTHFLKILKHNIFLLTFMLINNFSLIFSYFKNSSCTTSGIFMHLNTVSGTNGPVICILILGPYKIFSIPVSKCNTYI